MVYVGLLSHYINSVCVLYDIIYVFSPSVAFLCFFTLSHSLTFSFGFNVYMFYLLLVLLIAFLFYFLLNKQRSVIHVLLCIVSKNGLILLCCSLGIFSYFLRMTLSLYWLEEIFFLCSILIIQNFLISYTYSYLKNFHTSNSLFKEQV